MQNSLPGELSYVYTLRLIGPISYFGACYIQMKVTTFPRRGRGQEEKWYHVNGPASVNKLH